MNQQNEAKTIVTHIINNVYANYKNIPHREHTMQEAMDNVDDLVELEIIFQKLIDRRNMNSIPIDSADNADDMNLIEIIMQRFIDRMNTVKCQS